MILIDSSIWIDLFADRRTLPVAALRALIVNEQHLVVGDLILTEILQGARGNRHARTIQDRLSMFDRIAICDEPIAIRAAAHYRLLRARGITVRKTIDTLIATRCIVDDIPLLYAGRDFDPFVEHFGLRSALTLATDES